MEDYARAFLLRSYFQEQRLYVQPGSARRRLAVAWLYLPFAMSPQAGSMKGRNDVRATRTTQIG